MYICSLPQMSHVWKIVGIRKPFPDLSNNTVGHYFPLHSNCLPKESPSSDIYPNGAGLPINVAAILPNTTVAQHSPKLLIKNFSTFVVLWRCWFCLLGPPQLPMHVINYAWLAETFRAFGEMRDRWKMYLWVILSIGWLWRVRDIFSRLFPVTVPVPSVIGE